MLLLRTVLGFFFIAYLIFVTTLQSRYCCYSCCAEEDTEEWGLSNLLKGIESSKWRYWDSQPRPLPLEPMLLTAVLNCLLFSSSTLAKEPGQCSFFIFFLNLFKWSKTYHCHSHRVVFRINWINARKSTLKDNVLFKCEVTLLHCIQWLVTQSNGPLNGQLWMYLIYL